MRLFFGLYITPEFILSHGLEVKVPGKQPMNFVARIRVCVAIAGPPSGYGFTEFKETIRAWEFRFGTQ